MVLHLKTLSGIFSLAMVATPGLAADRTDLSLLFTATADIEIETMEKERGPFFNDPEEGSLLSTDQVFQIASAPHQGLETGALFENTELLIHIQSSDNSVFHVEPLSYCETLDLFEEEGLFAPAADCDDHLFKYTVNGHKIIILRNDEVIREYELKAGNYTINGHPVIFN